VSETSASEEALRCFVPLKITFSIFSERIIDVFCSPSTHRMASTMFDLPQPFGPTTPVIESLKLMVVFSGKLLNPFISKLTNLIPNRFGQI